MDIGSLYTDYYSKVANDSKNKKLSAASSKDYSNASDEELMEVCKEFESYFVEQILKQATEAFTDGDETSSGSMSTLQSYYKDNLIKEYSGKITENQDFGLAKTLYEQMKRNYSTDSIKDASQLTEQKEENQPENQKVNDASAIEAASTVLASNEE